MTLRWSPEQLQEYQRKRRVDVVAPEYTPKPERSRLEVRFEQQLETHGVAPWVPEFYFAKDRDWRFDFAWPQRKVAVEIQGAPHRIKGRFKADLEKRANALLQGWRVLELGRDQVRSEMGISWLKQLLA